MRHQHQIIIFIIQFTLCEGLKGHAFRHLQRSVARRLYAAMQLQRCDLFVREFSASPGGLSQATNNVSVGTFWRIGGSFP